MELRRETYPGQLNVTFTRGFVSSQAFVERYESKGKIPTLLPAKADQGLTFVPTHPLTKDALAWMGFEERSGARRNRCEGRLLTTIGRERRVEDDCGRHREHHVVHVLFARVPVPDAGVIKNAITKVTKDEDIFVYGISDKKVGGIDLQKPDGNVQPVSPAALAKNVPEPFKTEPVGGGGNRMHHKFVVIDFDKPTARVYLGSYNFSSAADIIPCRAAGVEEEKEEADARQAVEKGRRPVRGGPSTTLTRGKSVTGNCLPSVRGPVASGFSRKSQGS